MTLGVVIAAALYLLAPTLVFGASQLGVYNQNTGSSPQGFKRAVMEPRKMGHDPRFKAFYFTPNTAYRVVTVFDNPSFIEFEDGEVITGIINPKKTSWQFYPVNNRLFLQPLESDANTQVTVMSNKRMYFFELYAVEPDRNFDQNYTFFFKFKYPTDEDAKTVKTYARSILPDVDQNPWKYNFNYTISGEDTLYPVKIFDDGEFTYFEFQRNARLPGVFAVDVNGFESLVNFRIVGEYLIVETTAPRFTLRNGADIVCIFNENLYTPSKGSDR